MKFGENHIKIALLVLVVLFGISIIYTIHYNFEYYNSDDTYCVSCKNPAISYPYPVHADEWAHLSQGIYIMEKGRLPAANPYTGKPYRDIESGFHAFIAEFFTMTGLDPVLNYKFLPVIFIILIILSLIIALEALTKNFYIGLIASLFLLSVRNNINIMGLWFFLPMTLGIFILFIFYSLLFSRGPKSMLILFYILSIFVYPLATMIITFTLLLEFIINKSWRKHPLLYALYSLPFIAGFIFLMRLLDWRISSLKSFIIYNYGWTTGHEVQYSLYNLYPWFGILFAVAGLYFIWKKYNKSIISWSLFCILPIITYTFMKFSLFVPYQRGLLYFLIGLAPLSAIGLYHTFAYLGSILKKKYLIIPLIIILSCAMLFYAFNGYQIVQDGTYRPYLLINDNDYQALLWLGQNYNNLKLIAPWDVTFAVYPVSKNRVMAVPASNLAAGDIDDAVQFYSDGTSCSYKKKILDSHNVSIIYSRTPVICQGFNLIYSQSGVYIYRNT